MKTTTRPLEHSKNRSPLRLGFLLTVLVLALAWLAPLQLANAQCPQTCDSTSQNTAFGLNALPGDSGTDNTAIGFNALYSNTNGGGNTATGWYALSSNTNGFVNTATGWGALYFNRTGDSNTASGSNALYSNTTGAQNTASGHYALYFNNGNFNTAIGNAALFNLTIGDRNIAVGYQAGFNLDSGNSNIDIGSRGSREDHETIRIGSLQSNTYIAGVSGATVPTGVAVVIDTDGHLGTTTSSARFKENIQRMDKASEAVLALQPVTFRYKHELDPKGILQFGLVAEDVEKVNPDLVARDEQGNPYTVRYEAVNAMLLNEFLKEHQTVQELKKQVAELTAGLEKVSAQSELKGAPQTVQNSR